MKDTYATEQETFWAGEFGEYYVDRNSHSDGIAYRTALFSSVLTSTLAISSVLEFGANVGHNLRAIRNLLPQVRLSAIEINQKAISYLKEIEDIKVFEGSILDFYSENLGIHDLTFTCGVLIHINPQKLPAVYAKLYECSSTYVLLNEYYNPTPVAISYRGHSEKLFKRDFAGELLDQYSDLELVNYGFQYHRDNNFPSDDMTWFLLKKRS